jgi:hypothetical protein
MSKFCPNTSCPNTNRKFPDATAKCPLCGARLRIVPGSLSEAVPAAPEPAPQPAETAEPAAAAGRTGGYDQGGYQAPDSGYGNQSDYGNQGGYGNPSDYGSQGGGYGGNYGNQNTYGEQGGPGAGSYYGSASGGNESYYGGTPEGNYYGGASGAPQYDSNPVNTTLRKIAFAINLVCTIILAIPTFGIALIWCIPMTVYSYRIINSPYKHTGFGVCCILFLGVLAGILILCSGGSKKSA